MSAKIDTVSMRFFAVANVSRVRREQLTQATDRAEVTALGGFPILKKAALGDPAYCHLSLALFLLRAPPKTGLIWPDPTGAQLVGKCSVDVALLPSVARLHEGRYNPVSFSAKLVADVTVNMPDVLYAAANAAFTKFVETDLSAVAFNQWAVEIDRTKMPRGVLEAILPTQARSLFTTVRAVECVNGPMTELETDGHLTASTAWTDASLINQLLRHGTTDSEVLQRLEEEENDLFSFALDNTNVPVQTTTNEQEPVIKGGKRK